MNELFTDLLRNPEQYQTRCGKEIVCFDRKKTEDGYENVQVARWFPASNCPIRVGVRYPSGHWSYVSYTAKGNFSDDNGRSNLDIVKA